MLFRSPHCAVLGASPALLETIVPDKLLPSTNAVPERFELGTLPYELLAGVTAAVDVLASLAPAATGDRRARLRAAFHLLYAHELRLRRRIEDGLAAFGDAVVLHSRAADRTPTLFLTMPGRRTADAAAFLAARHVHAPAGSFYAYEAFRRLGVDDPNGLRIGIAAYTDDADVTRLLEGLAAFLGR